MFRPVRPALCDGRHGATPQWTFPDRGLVMGRHVRALCTVRIAPRLVVSGGNTGCTILAHTVGRVLQLSDVHDDRLLPDVLESVATPAACAHIRAFGRDALCFQGEAMPTMACLARGVGVAEPVLHHGYLGVHLVCGPRHFLKARPSVNHQTPKMAISLPPANT
jgi:hypothetical protein